MILAMKKKYVRKNIQSTEELMAEEFAIFHMLFQPWLRVLFSFFIWWRKYLVEIGKGILSKNPLNHKVLYLNTS